MNELDGKRKAKWKLVSKPSQSLGYIEILYYEDKNQCHIEVIDSNLKVEKSFSDYNYKMALQLLREQIEPEGYKIACNGCLPNITYSGMLLGSSLGLSGYLITDINEPVDVSKMVKSFDSSPTEIWENLATLEESRQYRKLHFENLKAKANTQKMNTPNDSSPVSKDKDSAKIPAVVVVLAILLFALILAAYKIFG